MVKIRDFTNNIIDYDFNLLTTSGNIAFYQSCEVTEIFLQRKRDKRVFNFFTIAVFEEKPFGGKNHTFLSSKLISIDKEYSLGIQRYWFSIEEIKNKFYCLKENNKWSFDDSTISHFSQLKYLPKQFVPSIDEGRLNRILKNNFYTGSYILEFFDEEKTNLEFLLKSESINKFNELCEKIKQHIPIELSVVRDRIGNFIFQFPITLFEVDTKALATWDGVELKFAWHSQILTIPNCLLQVESTLDKNYMGCVIEEYNKTTEQKIHIGNLDQINHIKIWKKEPSLILYNYTGTFIRDVVFNFDIINHELRLFELNGKIVQVQVASQDNMRTRDSKINYITYISNNLYEAEKEQLEKSLSFKQYKGKETEALNDLRKLIKQYDKNGVYLWDPFLCPTDILKTLYYSPTAGVPLKAIGAITDTVKAIFEQKGKMAAEIISEYKKHLENPKNNNWGLNFEFRIQHSNYGGSFHDRFLIFPGKNELNKPKVYSLGTSINAYGKNHHILQEVSYPQPVVDAFNELWEELNHKYCIVWKHPK
jgi:hypothetical protein